MTQNYTYGKEDIFSDICSGYFLWDAAKLDQTTPEFSRCFVDSVLTWAVYGFLWVVFIPLCIYIQAHSQNPPLPWTILQTLKTVSTVFLFFLVIIETGLQSSNGYGCSRVEPPPAASYIAMVVKCASLILILILEQCMRRRGINTSGVPFVFWCLVAVSDILPVYIAAKQQPWCSTSTVLCIRFAVEWLQVFLRCFADYNPSQPEYKELGEKPCPEESASVLNRITYSWLTSLVIKAYKTTLTPHDLWLQSSRLRSEKVVAGLQRAWRKEIKAAKKKRKDKQDAFYKSDTHKGNPTEKTPIIDSAYLEKSEHNPITFTELCGESERAKPSLYKALTKTFGFIWFEGCFYKVVEAVCFLSQPLILQQIIAIIERRSEEGVTGTGMEWQAYAYMGALFVTSVLRTIFFHCSTQHMVVLGLSIKAALIGMIYKKALTMSNSARKGTSTGEIVNLVSVDCQRINNGFFFSFYILSLPFTAAVSMIQLWYLMGFAMFGGLAVFVLVISINVCLGRVQQRLQKEILAFKTKRCKVLNEILLGIKVLKMYTWEKPFQQRVLAMRQEEINHLWKYALISAASIMVALHSPFLIHYVLVLIYTLSRPIPYLDALTAFVSLSLVNTLRTAILLIPSVITGVMQIIVSVKRIQAFLWKEDIREDNIMITDTGEYPIQIDNGTFTWNRSEAKPTLKQIDIKVKENQIYAVVGQVGCGKSSLIAALLGEMERLEGTVAIKGKVAYVPQEAWIQNQTVRDNILFDRSMDEERYNAVLSRCALLPDLEALSAGDMTEIGEKGINISGGQKQRVSLARAVYSDADMYLLDDPLSAVDSHVGKHLFKHVIGPQGLLKDKTRILVTHGIHWLPMVDQIIVMVNGKVSESGSYDELLTKKGAFAQFLQSFLDEEADDTEEDEDLEVRELREKVLSDVESVTGLTSDSGEDAVATLHVRQRKIRGKREKPLSKSSTKIVDAESKSALDKIGKGRLTQEERLQKGTVKVSVFIAYARAMGVWSVPLVMVLMLVYQGLNVYSSFWLTYWTEDTVLRNVSQGQTHVYQDTFVYYLIWYTMIGIIKGLAVLAYVSVAFTRMVGASAKLHEQMLQSILRSPMSFFDTTPLGRIMNRFSSDVDELDDNLPLSFRQWSIHICSTLATVVVVSINTPLFMIVIVLVGVLYTILLKFFLPTARQMKRLEAALRSPIFNHFSETITGTNVIQAYRCEERFIQESQVRVDTNVKFFFAAMTANRWIAVRLEFLGSFLVLAATLFALMAPSLNGAEVGLSISYALMITNSMNLMVQSITKLEMGIVSAERVHEYTELTAEEPWTNPDRQPSSDWPRSGTIEFQSYKTRYREGLDLVLKGISCHINSGEKLGIVGRTGAGKSSLTLSLFRLIEGAGGHILVDGRNVAEIGLQHLRSKLTILPQDPVLFSGSLRSNLDPFGRFDDDAIWKALECAHLKTAVQEMSGLLEHECGEGGGNLSMGQRQLVCLARTLLHKTRILILDEATAAVDLETDELIQNTIRTEFSDCTILTIAHRLSTILDYDRVMVLSDGQILELDKPSRLLQDSNSAFFKMVKDAGLMN